MALPRVAVASLGGTITMTADGSDAGVTPTLGAENLLAAVPGLDRAARIEAALGRRFVAAEIAGAAVVIAALVANNLYLRKVSEKK